MPDVPVKQFTEAGWEGFYQDFQGIARVPYPAAVAAMPGLGGLPRTAARLVEAAITAECTWVLRRNAERNDTDITVWVGHRCYRHKWPGGRIRQSRVRSGARVSETTASLLRIADRNRSRRARG